VPDERRTRLWGLIAERAGLQGAAVSAAHACTVAAAVGGVDGGWLSVMSDPAHRALVHATDRRAAELEELQFTLGEGPCTDAFGSGNPVLVADLEAPGWRAWWPGFAVAGVAAGAAALFAFPLVQGAIRVGVLGLYRETPGSLSPGALADVLVCADAALLLLLNSRAGLDGNGDGWAQDGWSDDHARDGAGGGAGRAARVRVFTQPDAGRGGGGGGVAAAAAGSRGDRRASPLRAPRVRSCVGAVRSYG
jgi:hypothetical protein